ncbi:MAG: NapC/NirT family cytochrome c [Halioglobus sp.]|nr:NapC/NirT family cytochrome c [Halioglobus sp.]
MKVRWVMLLIGLGVGVASVLAFDTVMYATSTEAFCAQSCHEMQTPYASLSTTPHFSNARGVSVSCADCHIPQEFGPKMLRKLEASREVWGHVRGIIDTPEKYAAHRPAMRERELRRMRANDSQECRNCHSLERMDFDAQSRAVRRYHRAMDTRGKTCIDCHADVGHPDAG